jgi:hypothetical protein
MVYYIMEMEYCCDHCKSTFKYRSNYYRHKKTYHNYHSNHHNNNNHHKSPKIKVNIKKKETPDIRSEVAELREHIYELTQCIKTGAIGNTYNTNNNNYYNIVISNNIYDEMVKKFGREQALYMLTSKHISKNAIEIIKALYLDDNDPAKYPIACVDNNHFRYLNDKKELVDDYGGKLMQKYVVNVVTNAMLLANNEIINECQSAGSRDIDLRQIQNNVMNPSPDEVIKNMAQLVKNRFHPFFHNGDDMVRHITFND